MPLILYGEVDECWDVAVHGNEITWKILKGEKTKKYDLEKIVEIVNDAVEGRTVFGVGVHKGKFEGGQLVWDNGSGCTGEHELSSLKTPNRIITVTSAGRTFQLAQPRMDAEFVTGICALAAR